MLDNIEYSTHDAAARDRLLKIENGRVHLRTDTRHACQAASINTSREVVVLCDYLCDYPPFSHIVVVIAAIFVDYFGYYYCYFPALSPRVPYVFRGEPKKETKEHILRRRQINHNLSLSLSLSLSRTLSLCEIFEIAILSFCRAARFNDRTGPFVRIRSDASKAILLTPL